MTTDELRDAFLVDLFEDGKLNADVLDPFRLRHEGVHLLLGDGRRKPAL